mmetsp:Transcript_4745/g.8284  ORF Transcript_4745/g.8284 Transcript_4745/m.8284 type:complete len:332 (-) Transcript_4745:75-1070(-)
MNSAVKYCVHFEIEYESDSCTDSLIQFENVIVGDNPKSFVQQFHNAAYTTAMTYNTQQAVINYPAHIDRLIHSSNSILNRTVIPEHLQKQTKTLLRVLSNSILGALNVLNASKDSGNSSEEALLIICYDGACHNLYIRASFHESILSMDTKYETVELRHGFRVQPLSKNTNWVNERQYLESVRHDAASETILCNDNCELLEGTVSNLFIVNADGSVSTSNDLHVLNGHMRGLVLEVLRELNVKVCMNSVCINECVSQDGNLLIEGMFLTSAVRFLNGVENVYIELDRSTFPLKQFQIPVTVQFTQLIQQIKSKIILKLNLPNQLSSNSLRS